MAKSLRSKRKRKMRAIKRIRYGQKELTRLQEMINKSNNKSKEDSNCDHNSDNQLIGTQFVKVSLTQKNEEKPEKSKETEMEVDSMVIRNNKTLRDQFGQYPVWMSGRQIKKHKNKLKTKRIGSKKK